jgi:hypothetical protein
MTLKPSAEFGKISQTHFLQGIGRGLLDQLFARFAAELAVRGVVLPQSDWPDDKYYQSLAALATAPAGLPDNLVKTLITIGDLADASGQERLETALTQAGLDLQFAEPSSPGDIAVQVFLTKPELLVDCHDNPKMGRLTAFEYYAAKAPNHARPAAFFSPPDAVKANSRGEEKASVVDELPTPATLERLTHDLDEWFSRHNRGRHTVQMDVKRLNGELVFLIRHGDTFLRTAKLDGPKMEILHYRPAKDDMVVYSPRRDEIRIQAGTRGEKELYRQAFGARLRGDLDYFSERQAGTLEPLRTDGVDALDVTDIPGIARIVLREIEAARPGKWGDATVCKSADIFASAAARNTAAIPPDGQLVRAVLDLYFEGSPKSCKVQLRPPNMLQSRTALQLGAGAPLALRTLFPVRRPGGAI